MRKGWGGVRVRSGDEVSAPSLAHRFFFSNLATKLNTIHDQKELALCVILVSLRPYFMVNISRRFKTATSRAA